MKNAKKIFQTLLIINSIQLAVGLCVWGYMSKSSIVEGQYFVFAAMGLMILSCMITLAGLYMAQKSSDNRFEESIRDLEELNTTLRAQRHDYLNHFQVIYGLMELEEYEEARKYLEPVFKDIMKAGRALKTAQPAVNALLQEKWKTAEDHGIEVYLEVRSDLSRLPIEAWNLCKVLANIIDNAIYALNSQQGTYIAAQESDEQTEEQAITAEKSWLPQLQIQITEEQERYYFAIANNGPMIPTELQEKIFRQGVTTKQEEGHGMGLYIVDRIVKEAGGKLDLQSSEERTVFHVVLPKKGQ